MKQVILNKELYDSKSIEKAIEDYKDFLEVIVEKGDKIILNFDKDGEIIDEFLNYLLGLSINFKRV